MKILKKISKRNILRIAIILLVLGGIFVFDAHMGIGVFAQGTTQGQQAVSQTSSMDTIEIIDTVLKIMYMLFYPLIFLAGLAMDNSLVYGEVFHLDVPLWKFWNVIKNLANFTLGFLVLVAILKNVFNISKKVDDVKKVITSTLLAGVLIQASWFISAALIDISTVATYGIGALPMSVLKGNDKIGKEKILATETVFDVDKTLDSFQRGEAFRTSFKVKYNSKDIVLSPCEIKQDSKGDSYIIGRKYPDAIYQNYGEFGGADITACVVNGKEIVLYNENPLLKGNTGSIYESNLAWILSLDDGNWDSRNNCGYIIKINGGKLEGSNCATKLDGVKQYFNAFYPDATEQEKKDLEKSTTSPANINMEIIGFKAGDNWFQKKEVEALTVSDLVDKSKGLVGPMMTIFSSMMNFSQISDYSQKAGVGAIGMETLIKFFFAMAIFFPLLALTLVLIARIGFLRLVIAMSPFIILLHIFKDGLGKLLGKVPETISLNNILKTIFAPVITVFALSMSIIFLQTLIAGFNTRDDKDCKMQKQMAESMGITPIYEDGSKTCNTNEYAFLDGLVKIKANGSFDWTGTADLLSWTIVNLMAIALIWFLLFAAIKAGGKIGETVGKAVQDFGGSVMKTMPIMPVPGGGPKVGVGTWKNQIFGGDRNPAVWNKRVSNVEQEQEMELAKRLSKKENGNGAEGEENKEKNKRIVEYVNAPTTKNATIDDLNKGKKEGQTDITSDYITRADTIKEIENALSKTDKDYQTKLNNVIMLFKDAMDKKFEGIKYSYQSKDLLESDMKEYIDQYNKGNEIYKKYFEDFEKSDKNKFMVGEGQNQKTYRIVTETKGDKREIKIVENIVSGGGSGSNSNGTGNGGTTSTGTGATSNGGSNGSNPTNTKPNK